MSIETKHQAADATGHAKTHGVSSERRGKETKGRKQQNRVEPTASVVQQSERVLEEQVRAVLSTSSYYAVRCVAGEVCDGVLILRGRVPSFYLKQVAQTAVRDVLDGRLVLDNQLELDQT